MAYDRCPCCKGKKTMVGLGGMLKNCKECDGVGYVKPAEVAVKRVRVRKPKESIIEE